MQNCRSATCRSAGILLSTYDDLSCLRSPVSKKWDGFDTQKSWKLEVQVQPKKKVKSRWIPSLTKYI